MDLKKTYKKLHKWPGLIIAFILLYYALSGILMNHRELIAGLDVKRENLPEQFHYRNWNNAALKGNVIVNPDSILLFGNIGVWVSDGSFGNFRSLNAGFPKGADNRKVFDLHLSPQGDLYAATLMGLYVFNQHSREWETFDLPVKINRFVAIESVGDTLFVLNRSYLFKGKSAGINTVLTKQELPKPAGFVNEVGLFQTVWQIHSGEIFGLPGKLFVDLLGVITIILSLTGIVYFLFPAWIKRRKRKDKSAKTMVRINKWSIKWHNSIGEWTFVFLIILFFTGMFLRPPLLISIANSKVKPIKFSHLDQPNPWHDKLRDMVYNAEEDYFILASSDGMFSLNTKLDTAKKMMIQPPVSVMGITHLQPFEKGGYLIGSFSGLFLWHPNHFDIYNYAAGKPYAGNTGGRPIGDFKISGVLSDTSGQKYMVDYDKGIWPLYHKGQFPSMPDKVLKASKMSLWNFSLEVHTGRIFGGLLGPFYILLVPLSGLVSIMVVLSGYLLWRKRRKGAKKSKKKEKK